MEEFFCRVIQTWYGSRFPGIFTIYLWFVMKICAVYDEYQKTHPRTLKIIKKWIFWILLDHEAFFVAKYFSMKITKHDRQHIKVGFPISSQHHRLEQFANHGLWYLLIDKSSVGPEQSYQIINQHKGVSYQKIHPIDLQDYEITKNRILWLYKLGLEEKIQSNFLLKDKIEELYIIISQWLIKMPKIERRYFREKIEKMFMELLSNVYEFMYFPSKRVASIENIIQLSMIIREMTRFLYKLGKIHNDNAFLQTWEKWVEVLKITKSIQQKQNKIYTETPINSA